MRHFKDGDEIFDRAVAREVAFPVMRDLVVDRSVVRPHHPVGRLHLSRTPAARRMRTRCPISKGDADEAFEAAACIGCGACVAACKNASAMLFVSAKVVHLGKLPQGQPERN